MKKVLSKDIKVRLEQLMDLPLNYLTINDYNQINLEWIKKYAENHNFSIEDVFYCLSHAFYEKLDEPLLFVMTKELFVKKEVSISFLQRHLNCGYKKAINYINDLLKDNIIKKENDVYKVVSQYKFVDFIKKNKNQIIW